MSICIVIVLLQLTTDAQLRRHLVEVSSLIMIIFMVIVLLQLIILNPHDFCDQASSWGSLKPGRGVFLKERCPVSSCVLASNR